MRLLHFCTFLALLASLLGACGGSGGAALPADPNDAYDAGLRALNENQYATALKAFRQVSEDPATPDPLRYDALLSLGEVQVLTHDMDGAVIAFQKARSDYGHLYDVKGCKKIVDAYIRANDVERADAELAAAYKRFPDQREVLDGLAGAIKALRSGDVEKLAELGYVGD